MSDRLLAKTYPILVTGFIERKQGLNGWMWLDWCPSQGDTQLCSLTLVQTRHATHTHGRNPLYSLWPSMDDRITSFVWHKPSNSRIPNLMLNSWRATLFQPLLFSLACRVYPTPSEKLSDCRTLRKTQRSSARIRLPLTCRYVLLELDKIRPW